MVEEPVLLIILLVLVTLGNVREDVFVVGMNKMPVALKPMRLRFFAASATALSLNMKCLSDGI